MAPFIVIAPSQRSILALFACVAASCADPPAPHAPAPVKIAATSAPVEETPSTSELVPVGSDDPILGPKRAKVTIVVFSDFQCPYCARVEPTLARVRQAYPDDVRIVWKDNPLSFHKYAREAAILGRVVFETRGAEAFFRYHDTVFQNQAQLSADALLGWAGEQSVGASEIDARRADAEAKIDASLDLGRRVGISGTPGFVIDGERLSGSRPFEEFAAIVDRHLAEANALAQKGTAPEAIYDALVRAHFTPPQDEKDDDVSIDPTIWNVPLGDAPVRGDAGALVTIVEFADFQCPFCKRNNKTLAALEAKFPGKLRFAFKHAPLSFHKQAMPAAMLAIEARKQGGDAAFFKAHDLLYASPSLGDDDLSRIATTLGLDAKKASDAIAKSAWKAAVERDQLEGDDLEVKGTPCTFVNGRRIEGAQPLAVFEQVVQEELAKADTKVKSGTPLAKLYAETIAGGKGGPADLSVPKTAPWKGGAKAAVVVQVFSDFQCPFCRKLEVRDPDDQDGITGALAAATKKYGDKIKIVWRDFPLEFHPRARAAASLAREAFAEKGNAGFWKVHDELFANQADLGDAALEVIAKKAGLDAKKVRRALDEGTWSAAIDDDQKEGNRLGISGTPTVFVDGHRIVGAQPEAVLTRAIDRALAQHAK